MHLFKKWSDATLWFGMLVSPRISKSYSTIVTKQLVVRSCGSLPKTRPLTSPPLLSFAWFRSPTRSRAPPAEAFCPVPRPDAPVPRDAREGREAREGRGRMEETP